LIDIYIYIVFKNLNDMIVIKFILDSPFHIKKINILHGFFNQSHVWGYSWAGLLIFMIKSIRDNYRIYGLIIVKTTKNR